MKKAENVSFAEHVSYLGEGHSENEAQDTYAWHRCLIREDTEWYL